MKLAWLLCILLVGRLTMVAQNDAPTYHPIDKGEWENTVEGLDYIEKQPKKKEINPQEQLEIKQPFDVSVALKIAGFAIIIGILIFALLKFLGVDLFKNQKVTAAQSTITALEEKPMESDLERFLREALSRKDFRLAIRIYYLMVLKSLNERGSIKWKKEKTNMDYLQELRSHPKYEAISSSTFIFEVVWYGEKDIRESQYNNLSSPFIELLQQLKPSK